MLRGFLITKPFCTAKFHVGKAHDEPPRTTIAKRHNNFRSRINPPSTRPSRNNAIRPTNETVHQFDAGEGKSGRKHEVAKYQDVPSPFANAGQRLKVPTPIFSTSRHLKDLY